MQAKALLCGVVLLLLTGMAGAQEPEIRQFDVATLEKLGRDIYEIDQAAWHATDALTKVHPQAELAQQGVRGWIVEIKPEGALVRFIRQGADGFEAAYDIHDANGKPRVSVPDNRSLTDEEKARYNARTLAATGITQRCGDNYNTVVLKDPHGDGWLVWALAATSKPGLVMTGGHRRPTVSADGTKVLRADALSRSCLVLEENLKPGTRVEALITTQLVSSVPVETFIFLNLQHRLPFLVVTPDKNIWGIDRGTMQIVDKLDK